MRKIGTGLGFLLVACILTINTAYAGSKNTIVIGANLSNYKKPTKKQCNINVPSQYLTIQAGVNAAVNGDTICVGPGTFNEDVWINKSIRLSGNGFTSKTIINGQNNTVGAISIYANNVILEGFVINGFGYDPSNAALLIGEASSNVTIQYNDIIAGNGGRTLRADAGQNNHLIQNNILEGTNSPKVVTVDGAPLDPSKPSNNVGFISNTFIGTVSQTVADTGVVLIEHATNSLIERNVFNTNSPYTKIIDYAYGSGIGGVHYNNFNSVADTKVYVSVGTLNAENNWWGDTDPSDNIVHDVDYTPFATKPFNQYAQYPITSCFAVLCDNFNSYSDGQIVGQGWFDRENGVAWTIQSSIAQEGSKALSNFNSSGESIVTKNSGIPQADGRQSFYVRTENRSNWTDYHIPNFQFGMFQDSWDGPSRVTVGFGKDGQVSYVDAATDSRVNFAAYEDNTWNLIDIEWRSTDKAARFRLNSGGWTDWILFTGGAAFTGFDTIGIDGANLGTSGVYIDKLN